MSMPTDSPARLTGREYVDQYLTPLMAQFNVAREHVDVSYLAATSQVRLVSREFATTGEAGKFINEKTFGYLKQDLAVMFPAPLLYVGPWPVTYRTLVQSLRATYGLVIEEGEFTLSNGLVTLTPNPDTEITLEPPVTNGTFTFTATATSLRFRAGTAFRLLVHTSTGRVRLNALYDLPVVGRMAWLSNNADETAAVNTLVLSEGRSCVRDLFVRAYGYLPPESQIDTTFDFSNGRCVATVRGRDREVGTNAIGKFAGAATMEIERIKISSIISAPLNIDGTYSMSYEAFKRFMLNSFGLRIEDGEFYIGSDPLKQPLGPRDTVQFSPDGNNQDRLVVTSTSLRFLPEDGFTMRLIYAGEFVVIGNVPTYTEGETIDFQYALRGGFPPYNLLDVVGLPSTITLSQTGRLQGTAPAGSYPVIARYNDRMNSVAYLNDTIVVEVADVTPEPTEGFQMLGFRSEDGSTDLTPLPVPAWTAEGAPVIADGPLVKSGKVTLDGASYLKTGLHEIFDFGTDDFTFEFSVDYTDLPDTFAVALFATANAQLGDPDTGMAYMYAASEGLPPGYSGTFLFGTSETGLNAITSTIPLPSGKTKISITRRNGTDLHLFYNEQQAGVGTVSAEVPINFSKAQGITLGAVISSTDVAKWKGDIYDMRVIKGLAMYQPASEDTALWYITANQKLYSAEWDKFGPTVGKGVDMPLAEILSNEFIELNYSQSYGDGFWRPLGETDWRAMPLAAHGRCLIGTKIWSVAVGDPVQWFDTATGQSGVATAARGNLLGGCKKLIVKYNSSNNSWDTSQISTDGGTTWKERGDFIGFPNRACIATDGQSVMLGGVDGGNINIARVDETGTVYTRQLSWQGSGDAMIGIVPLEKGWMILMQSGRVFTSPEADPLNFTEAAGFPGSPMAWAAAGDGERVLAISRDGVLWSNNDFAQSQWSSTVSPVSNSNVGNIMLRGQQYKRYNVADDIIGSVNPTVWYRLNDVAPNGVAADSSGNGYHGTYSATAAAGVGLSVSGKSLAPQGQTTQGGFTLPGTGFTLNATNAKGQFWSVFVKRDPTKAVGSQYQHIVGSSGDAGLTCGFQVDTNDLQVQWNMRGSHVSTAQRPRTPMSDKEAHMYTIVYRPQDGRDRYSAYVDGQRVVAFLPNSEIIPQVFNQTLYGGSPNDYGSSYGNCSFMSELMAGPGWETDSEEASAIAKLYDLLKRPTPVFEWDGQWYDYNRPYTNNYYPEGLFIPEWNKLALMEYYADGSFPLIVNTPYDHQRVGKALDIRANQTGHTMTYSPKHDAIFISGYFGSYLMYGPSQNYRTVSPNGAIYDGSTGWARTRWIAEWDMFVGIDGASLVLGKSSDGITWTKQDLPARSSTYPSGDSIYAMDWDPIEKRLIILQSGGNVIEMRTPTQMTVLAQHPFGGHQGDALHWSKVWNKFVFVKFQGTDVGFFTSTDAISWTKLQVAGVDQAFRFTESTYFNEVYITSSGRLFRWSNETWMDITPNGKLIDRDTYPVFDEHNQALWLIFTGANPAWKCTKQFVAA
jgi:hypothetical protein